MEAVNPDAAGGDRMNPLMTISTALYVCEGCDDAGECNCYHADQLRHTPTHQWLCQTCYEDAKAEDDSGEVWPAWDELMRHPCMAAELIEARLAIAHMHDLIWLQGPEKIGVAIDMAECRAFSAGYDAALGAAVALAEAECDRILSKQDGKNDAVDMNLRLIALMLPEIADAIRALPAPGRPAAPAVKALVWRNPTPNFFFADAYEIWHTGDQYRLLFSFIGFGGYYSSLIDAQNAAQADHEARILAALEGP